MCGKIGESTSLFTVQYMKSLRIKITNVTNPLVRNNANISKKHFLVSQIDSLPITFYRNILTRFALILGVEPGPSSFVYFGHSEA